MRALDRKLFRELWLLRWQALAIGLVLASGVGLVVMSVSTLQSLLETRDAYYRRARFGEVFAKLKRAPWEVASRLREIPGVSAVEPRVVQRVTLDVAGLAEPATGLLVSLPPGSLPAVNRLHLRAGRLPEPQHSGEALVSEAFAAAHGLRPGDALAAVINGKLRRLRLVGIALSPEFIYSVRPGELLPDDRRFGVLWLGYDELAAAFDLDGAFNDVALTLAPRASQAAVIAQVDRLLAPYGGTDGFGRDQQASHRFLENELIQLRTMALVPPLIFLAVTGYLLHVVLSRTTALQREQIATLRAFGYTRWEVAQHFLGLALLIGLAGTVLGLALGARLGADLTALYTQFFRFPQLQYQLDWRLAAGTSLISLCAVLGGAAGAVWRAAHLRPAEAMQPEAPPRRERTLGERLGLDAYFSPQTRMILRQLERRPLRAALSSLAIALAVGILVMGSFVGDTVDQVMRFQFFEVQRYDLLTAFVEPSSQQAVRDLAQQPGVQAAEAFRSAPAQLAFGPRRRRLELLGLEPTGQLLRVVDPRRGPLALPPHGLVLSRSLADRLGCHVGDQVQVAILDGRRPQVELTVAAVVDDYLDLNAYLRIDELNRLLKEDDLVSGAFLRVDPAREAALFQQLKETPRTAGVGVKRTALESYRKTLAENLLRMQAINVAFAVVVACGVVYNCARIALAERRRELATLRVLGFTRGETAQILLGELLLLTAAAIPLGLVVGYGLAWLTAAALQTEVHRFPLVIHSRTFAWAAIVVLLAAGVTAQVVRRQIDQLNLVDVLKARD